MEVKITKLTSWTDVLNVARTTVSKTAANKEPSDSFKRQMLASEHSPIRALMFKVDLIDIPYWVSVHIVRHKIGVEHFVSTQRTDRTGEDRTTKPQDAPVNHTMILNAQAILTMSRRRLCGMASPETRRVWQAVRAAIEAVDPILAGFMQPMCFYRGGVCHEANGCGLRPRIM
jgi:hypothetical protein